MPFQVICIYNNVLNDLESHASDILIYAVGAAEKITNLKPVHFVDSSTIYLVA